MQMKVCYTNVKYWRQGVEKGSVLYRCQNNVKLRKHVQISKVVRNCLLHEIIYWALYICDIV